LRDTVKLGEDRTRANGLLGQDASFPIAGNLADPERALFGVGDLYESTDGGTTVQDILFGPITAFSYAGLDNPFAVYAGVTSQTSAGVSTESLEVRSVAGGLFTIISTPPWGNASAAQIVVDPNNWRTVYVRDSAGRIWRTTDGGATASNWTDLTDNLTGPNGLTPLVESIALADGVLLASGPNGVFRRLPESSFTGYTWTKLGQFLPNVDGTDVHYVAPSGTVTGGDFVLVGTYGRGAWILPNASSFIASPSTLQVTGDENGQVGANDDIIMQLDPTDSSKLQIIVNGKTEYDGSYAYFSSVEIDSGGGGGTIDIHDIPPSLSVSVIQSGAQTMTLRPFLATQPDGSVSALTITGDPTIGSLGDVLTITTSGGDTMINLNNEVLKLPSNELGHITAELRRGYNVVNAEQLPANTSLLISGNVGGGRLHLGPSRGQWQRGWDSGHSGDRECCK
jgi:hypothetical protein